MNFYLFSAISAFSITIPCAMAIYSYKQMKTRYNPLLAILFLGFLNETISWLMIQFYGSNLITANVYTLIEFLLYYHLFNRLKKKTKIFSVTILVLGLLVWITDNLILHTLFTSNSLFRLFSSLVIIWYSVEKLAELTLYRVADRFKKPDLLLCFSLLVYFTFKGFIHVVNAFSIVQTPLYFIHLWMILCFLNILVNLSIFIVVLCIPKPQATIRY
jgi:hypothetical protein